MSNQSETFSPQVVFEQIALKKNDGQLTLSDTDRRIAERLTAMTIALGIDDRGVAATAVLAAEVAELNALLRGSSAPSGGGHLRVEVLNN